MSECVNFNDFAATSIDSGEKNKTCPAVGFQKVNICVPVTVTPFALAGATKTTCCGDPVVVSGNKPCDGKKNEACTFTISQVICVEVPVEFGAMSKVGDTFVDCLGASAYDICSNCKDEGFGGM